VQLTSVAAEGSRNDISLVGTVRSFTEAAITAERGGRVTSVAATIGSTVQAGQVLVSLENAAERAAVLQAEGSYEAALAAAAQSAIGTDEAATNLRATRNQAVTTVRTAYTTVDNVIKNNVDQFFSNPSNPVNPELTINGQGYSSSLVQQRIQLQSILRDWQDRTAALSPTSDFAAETNYAKSQIDTAIRLVDTFIELFSEQDRFTKYSEAQIAGFASTFGSLRSNLIAQQAQLDAVVSSLEAARDAVRRAELTAAGGTTSAADAQVKQALGSLRAAQANLAKTILRTPITGTVNELPVRVGDFIGAQTKVAEVANNNALEIVTYAGDNELFALQVGDTVTIEDEFTGTITTISPAVDSQTGKTEVRIASDNPAIKNGDTVRITTSASTEDVALTDVRVPLSAIKFEREDGYMFRVVNERLEKFPVSLGSVFGSTVAVTDGLGVTDEFVIDARGLREGDEVEIVE